MRWDYIEVVQTTWIPVAGKIDHQPVEISGDWNYGQHQFPNTSLIDILSWLGKDEWELVSATEHYQLEDEKERTAYLRRPTRTVTDGNEG